jgi:hypothetical protein
MECCHVLSALKIGSLQAVLLTQLIVTGDWNTPGGTWDYGHANSDPWNINGGLNGVTDICSFGDCLYLYMERTTMG